MAVTLDKFVRSEVLFFLYIKDEHTVFGQYHGIRPPAVFTRQFIFERDRLVLR